MPGTLVHDSLAPVLQATATLTSTATTTGVEVDKPGRVRVRLQCTGVVSGTNPTLDVEVQSSNDSAFGSGVVSHGKFAQLTATLGTASHYLDAAVYKSYMRVIETIGGTSTPTFTAVKITVEEPNYERVTTDTA